MPVYQIHRLREYLKPSFRNAAHTSGLANVKQRDYIPGETIDAATPYAAFFALRDAETPLAPGDLLEFPEGQLRVYKFVGFEPAQWVVPEAKTQALPFEPALANSGPGHQEMLSQ